MKKLLVTVLFGLVSYAAFAETLTFEEFSFKLMNEFKIDYVCQECYDTWNGDADACIKFYKKTDSAFISVTKSL